MKFAAGTLFFGLSVFVHSIELISSQPDRAQRATLIQLFPQSNGVHFPVIEEINEQSPGFSSTLPNLNGHEQLDPAKTYIKGGKFIIGYEKQRDITLLGWLFHQPYVYPVFDTENGQWYTLLLSELRRLGVGRSLALVRAQDEAHDVVHRPYQEVNSEAHNAACEVAFRKTKDYEGTFGQFEVDKTDEEANAKLVKEYYHRAYNEAFQSHAGGR